MSDGIDGKVIVITGGSSGLGEAMARHLAAKGASIMLGARREEKLQTIVSDIKTAGGVADYHVTDVTVASDVEALVQKAMATFGKVDVMVNNAGLMALAPLWSLKVDEWDRMIDINIKGVMYGVAAALAVFKQQKHGHIINISSIAGLKVFKGGAVYCGTKFAVRAISEGIRLEVGESIRTTCIEPGAIDTELTQGTSHSRTAEAISAMYENVSIPADSISRAVAYAIEQPADVDVSEIVVRPTAQKD